MANVALPVNMADVEAGGTFELMPPDVYEVEINNVELKKSQNGNDYLAMTYKVINNEEWAGRKLWDNVSLVKEALFRLKQLSLACGVEITDEFSTEDFLGETLEVSVDIENTNKQDDDGNFVQRNCVKKYIFSE